MSKSTIREDGIEDGAQSAIPETGESHEDGTVSVSATALKSLMSRLEQLEETNKLMLQVQDKNKVAQIEELRKKGKLMKSVKVRRYADKYITGWKLIKDEVYRDGNGRVIEEQIVRIFFKDGEHIEMPMRQWASAPEYVPFEVKKETRDDDGRLFFTCVGQDGTELEIDASFIN